MNTVLCSPAYWQDNQGRLHQVFASRRLNYSQKGQAFLRDFVMERDNNRCIICSKSNDLVIDHIISLKNGGTNHPDNLQTLYQSCNSRKTGLFDARRVCQRDYRAGRNYVVSMDGEQIHIGMLFLDKSISVTIPKVDASAIAIAIIDLIGEAKP